MVRSTHAPGRGRTLVAALALATLALTLPAWARMGGGGGHFGGHGGGFGAGHAVGARGGFGHGHGGGHFRGAVVIGGLGLWSLAPYPAYPYYPYDPYPYAPAAVVPGYNAPPPGQVWYYCDAAAGYYPYVTTCPGPWREVPVPAQPVPAPVQ